MYFSPELNGKASHGHNASLDDIELAEEVFCSQGRLAMRDNSFEEFEELAKMIMEDEGFLSPGNPSEALQLYIDLIEDIEDIR